MRSFPILAEGRARLDRFRDAVEDACAGHPSASRQRLSDLLKDATDNSERAQIVNAIAAIAACEGEIEAAREGFQRALAIDGECRSAQLNWDVLDSAGFANSPIRAESARRHSSENSVRIAVVSLLFNWPSTGGGTIHTYEACRFLQSAGHTVRHFYARQDDWELGQVTGPLAVESEELNFAPGEWTADAIRERFRKSVQRFRPDCVLITDSWNSKPLLAEAVREFPYFIRIAALEGLCPLNNVRLLVEGDGRASQCSRNQLADPRACRDCVAARLGTTGGLHRAERALAGFDDSDYPARLRRAFANAEAVLVVNPSIAELVRPFARQVCVVPSGFDPSRFSKTYAAPTRLESEKLQIVFAGLVEEFMKGFFVLQEAAARLWQHRRDFEVVATADPVGQVNDCIRRIGWKSQAELPQAICESDILAFPTVAQEALGRSAVEAMGCGRPVVASRIGGLSWVVDDGVTGLLFEPGNSADLAEKLKRLLDDAALRERLGRAGKAKFASEFTWDVMLERHYGPLLRGLKTARAV